MFEKFKMDKTYSIGFYGDLATGENYQAKYDVAEHTNVLRQKGYSYLFEKVEPILNKSNMNIVNLETTITSINTSSLAHKKTVLHWADTEIVPKLLKSYKIEAVSLGNNHAFDYDEAGLVQTIQLLKAENIIPFGAGHNIGESASPFVKNINIGQKCINLYVFGGFKYKPEYDKEFNFYSKTDKAGVFDIRPENILKLISDVKERDKDSFVVIFPHFGFDLMKTTQMQTEYAHAYIDAGADIVIGHGPHIMNSIERYNNKVILYGLGNFIFPANFQGKIHGYNLTAELEFTEDSSYPKVYLYPIFMDIQANAPQTRPIIESESNYVLDLLTEGQENLKNNLVIENANGLIRIRI